MTSESAMSTRNANPLEILGEQYQPSKRELDYLRHYWRHLGDVRHEIKKVCEIGVQTDGRAVGESRRQSSPRDVTAVRRRRYSGARPASTASAPAPAGVMTASASSS